MLIAHEGVLDGPRQVPGEEQAHSGGQEGEDGEAGHRVDDRLVNAAHPDAHRDKASSSPSSSVTEARARCSSSETPAPVSTWVLSPFKTDKD